MSWQSYIDDQLMYEVDGQHLKAAAIVGNDGTVWAQSADFPKVFPCFFLIQLRSQMEHFFGSLVFFLFFSLCYCCCCSSCILVLGGVRYDPKGSTISCFGYNERCICRKSIIYIAYCDLLRSEGYELLVIRSFNCCDEINYCKFLLFCSCILIQ